jgi:hypothetical protein
MNRADLWAEFITLHERLVGDEQAAIVSGCCRCGHDAELHHGAVNQCRGTNDGERCECRRFRGKVVLTDAGRAWQADEARWQEMVCRLGLTSSEVQLALKRHYSAGDTPAAK